MALDLTPLEVFLFSLFLVVAILFVAYGIAGWFERRARKRRDARLGRI